MSSGAQDQNSARTAPFSPLAQRAYDSDIPAWLERDRNLSSSSSQETLTPNKAREKAKFFTYESRSTTPEAFALDLGDIDSTPPPRQHQHQKEGSGDSLSSGTAVSKTSSEDGMSEVDVVMGGVGRLPEEVYDRTLNSWRAGLRRRILKNIEWESKILAAMQAYVRTPFLDAYFVYTSSLGTHTFFMTVLPAFFFFGYQEVGHRLLFVLALGVYASSFVKDLICAPRPFAPPVSRLTIGTHHLEYGFPSTHSTNSMSIALFLFSRIYSLYTTPAASDPSSVNSPQEMMLSQSTFILATSLLTFYVFSIVYGRLYTAMHSFTDCVFGVLLGTAIWWAETYTYGPTNTWLRESGFIVPAITIPLCLLLVHRHPQPVDDCPCFEDAIAFVSVILGENLSRWFMYRYHFDQTFFTKVMPGSPTDGTWAEVGAWWGVAIGKMTFGVLAIFAWRIFAKFLLHRMLPPIFRFLAQLVTLPHRRFYTPATDYKNVPGHDQDSDRLRMAIPSVIDLPGMVELEVDNVGESTARRKHGISGERVVKLRNGNGGGGRGAAGNGVKGAKGGNGGGRSVKEKEATMGLGMEEMGGKGEIETVKHYDADVLTKVFVYCGIGIVATGVMPMIFEVVGWGLKAW